MVRSRKAIAAMVAMIAMGTGVSGCSHAIGGTPVAPPGEIGAAALLRTTCREYASMTDTARRDVIAAIGQDGNKLVASNPDLWVGVAAALCSFVDPSAPVKDVVTGGIR